MKIVTKEMISDRIKALWPNEPFEIISYTKVSQPFTIKCLDCGRETTFSTCNNFLNTKKKAWCLCHQNNNSAKHLQNKQKILDLISEAGHSFIEFDYDEVQKKYRVRYRCKTCNQIIDKSWQSCLDHVECPYCENRESLNTQAVQSLLPKEYTLLSDYTDENQKVLMRHECGFIWSVLPRSVVNGHSGCPKCNRKRSKGEQKIAQWLKEHDILYEEE